MRFNCRYGHYSTWEIPESGISLDDYRGFLSRCFLVQGAGEGPPAQELGGLRPLLEKLRKCQGDVLEDFAVLLGREPRRDADIADEEIVRVAPHREARQLGAAGE